MDLSEKILIFALKKQTNNQSDAQLQPLKNVICCIWPLQRLVLLLCKSIFIVPMTEERFFVILDHSLRVVWRFVKWYIFQYVLLFLMPFVWGQSLGTGLSIFIALYTLLLCIFWEIVPKEKRLESIYMPFVPYFLLSIPCSILWNSFFPSWWIPILLPIFGAICFLSVKTLKKIVRGSKGKDVIIIVVIFVFLLLAKSMSVSWGLKGQDNIEGEKTEILQRRDYLVQKLTLSSYAVLDEMPSEKIIGEQFRGEWALYSCSMLSAALVNISNVYPETRTENLEYIDKLIQIVKTSEIRFYDSQRWGEDALLSLESDWSGSSHISYLSHLAWMISGYKQLGGGSQYDELFNSLCDTMNRRITQSPAYNLETYPGEPIYVPDMLVAIVALQQYAKLNKGKYSTTVKTWVRRARKEWCDLSTGLLVSFLDKDGSQFEDAPVKGSYSALNCSYLTYIDESFAQEQYALLKKHFWKEGILSGFMEYYDRPCPVGLDMDAGPIIWGLSPSGTAFAIGAVTYFDDTELRSQILRTAEIAGHTVQWNGTKHYALANVAIVGEAIMLAMRTNRKL